MDLEKARPFRELRGAPPNVRIPTWVAALIAAAVAGGALLGISTAQHGQAEQLLNAVFFASAFGYVVISMIDFREHFRLEKEATGRWLAFSAVPLGETLNHAATTIVVVAILLFARPLPAELEPRDIFVLIAPALFLALGWRDEVLYHRVRGAHREDIMHTTAHLAAGIMLTSFYALRLTRW